MNLPPHDWHAPIIAAIVSAYGRTRGPVYIELGVDRGHTMKTVLPHTSVAFGVDVTFGFMDPALRGEPKLVLCECSSDEFFADYDGPAPDVVFVDGDHSYEQVARDIYHSLDRLAPDGTIIVHDTKPERQEWADSHCGDGWVAVDEFRQRRVLQVFTLPLFPGLTLMGHPPEHRPK